MKKYLLFVTYSYCYSILRPIQDEIRRRGDQVAWYIEDHVPMRLHSDEKHLKTIKEVIEYNAIATFASGNRIYDFFPGIKVMVFHGLYYKRSDFGDHYKIRGFFDLYCLTSPMFLPKFKELEKKLGFFKVVETGWSKFDASFKYDREQKKNGKPTIIYAPTFSKKLMSAVLLYDKIEELVKKRDWNWLLSFHPKMDEETLDKYKELAEKYDNVTFSETEEKYPLFIESDVMVSDSSSVIYEFLWFDKPVVTYRNTLPDSHLIDISDAGQLEEAIEKALQRPPELMESIRSFMNQVHPRRDGKSSARILDAVDDFIANYKGKLKKKPLNLFRKMQIRKKVKYFPFGPRYRTTSD